MVFIKKIITYCFIVLFLIGMCVVYIYMVEYDTHNDRHIILSYDQTEYTMPLKLTPCIPYKVVLSQIGYEEYMDTLPFKLRMCIFSNDKIIHTYTTERLKLGYMFENDKKLGSISLNNALKIPLLKMFTPLKLKIFIEWETDLHIAEQFKLKVITSLSEI